MADLISVYMADDPYTPSISKPELQQWDNYQIHDLYCIDVIYEPITISGVTISPPPSLILKSFLAVEVYHPSSVLTPVDFTLIAKLYPVCHAGSPPPPPPPDPTDNQS
jgi:hypothetical protein